jgi:glyoxylase-like metal-dependent hydrolase (beta-lactamase superfamily II)
MMNQAGQHARLFGITMVNPQESRDLLMDGDVVSFGKSSLQVIHVPGHSPGSVAFFASADKLLFVGDILFEGSVGRTDLPGGNHDLLISGIKSKLLVLDEETRVFSGHGNETTIGWEKRTNPFLR